MRRGKNPHRWKGRRAGPQALRYICHALVVTLADTGVHPQPGFPPRYVRTEETCGAIRPPNRPAPQEKRVAQGSLSSLAVLPPRRGLGRAGHGNTDYLVCGAARTRSAGRAAGPDRRPCATSATPPTQRARRGFLHTNKGSQNASSWRCRVDLLPENWSKENVSSRV
jgi:hypothetical protein